MPGVYSFGSIPAKNGLTAAGLSAKTLRVIYRQGDGCG